MLKQYYSIILIVFISVLLNGCTKTSPDLSDIPPPPEKLEKLKVVMALPSGRISDQSELSTISVSFNQPMTPLATLPVDEPEGPISFEPPISGKYRWMGTSTLTFTPKDPLPPGINIKAKIPAGVKALTGAVLEKDFAWSFETLRPQIVSTFPTNQTKYVDLGSPVYLHFNMPVDSSAAMDMITVTGLHGTSTKENVSFKFREANEKDIKAMGDLNSKNAIIIAFDQKLKPGYRYNVEIKKGIKGKNAELASDCNYNFTFTTQNIFSLNKSAIIKEQNPEDSLYLTFTNPIYVKDLIKNITITPEVKIPDYYGERDYDTATVNLYLKFKPRTDYKVTVSKNLKDIFANNLRNDISFTFKTTDFNPSINMSDGSGIIESNTKRLLPVSFMNVNKVSLQMANIRRDEVIPILTGNAMDYDKRYEPGSNFFGVDREWKINTPLNEEQFLPIALDQVLGKKKSGFVFVQLDTIDKLKDQNQWIKSFVQVTNLGITGKFSPENNLIWVTTLDKAEPVKNAKVELRSDENKVIWQGTTNEKGLVETPGWSSLGLKKKERWDNPVIWVFASNGEDTAMINSAWGWGISPWVFNIDYTWNPDDREVSGYLFTERGLYRGGEDVRIKGIFREKKWGKWKISTLKTVNLRIKDSRDKEIFKQNVNLSDYGAFDRTIKLNEDASTGSYKIELWCSIPGKESYEVASDTFSVEDYQPADFKVTVDSQRKSYVFQDVFKGNIKGWYLFGAPMNADQVSWRYRLTPYDFRPKGYDDYLFGPTGYDEISDDEEENVKLLGTGDGKLNNEGRIDLECPLKADNIKQTMLLTVEGSVKSVNRNEISGSGEYVVHKGDYYIGIKPTSTFINSKGKQNIQIITVSPDGNKIAGEAVKLEILKREWHSVRKTGIDGTKEWVTEKNDQLIKSSNLTSRKEPVTENFIPEKAGYYIIRATGVDRRQNAVLSEVGFYAWGQDYVPWERTEDDVVKLIKNKNEYKPGDKAKIIVKSPYENAKALVTFEREYIIDRMIVDLKGSADVIEFPIKKGDMPNIFVSVVLIQGRVSDEKFSEMGEDLGKPSFRIGYVNLPIVSDEKKLNVTVKSDKERYKPGDEVSVRLNLRNNEGKPVVGEICLSAVDVGVLSLINYKTPNYYNNFYGSRSLSVKTSESRLNVIGQRDYGEKGENDGGGGGSEMSSIDLRTDFKATAYWNPTIKTNKSGETIVRFKLPDNLTTFRLMATAQTKDSLFGSAESELTVTKPLLLKPSYPRFTNINDIFSGGVMIFNGTKENGEVTVEAEVKNGIESQGELRKTVNISAGQEKEVLFNFKAAKEGEGELVFRAKMGSESDGFTCKIPVLVPRLTEAVATFGNTDKNRQKEELSLPKDIDSKTGGLYVDISSTALIGLKGGIDYLVKYPYECLEQRISKVLPAIMAQDLVEEFDLSANLKGKAYKDFVQGYLDLFVKYQKSNGGFGLWEDSQYDYEYLTCYALYAMAMAKNAGYNIDGKVVEKGLKYLRMILGRAEESSWSYPYNRESEYTIKCFALYDLYLFGKGDPSYLPVLFEKRQYLTLFGEAMLLKSLHFSGRNSDKEKIIIGSFMNKIKLTPTMAHFEEAEGTTYEWIFGSNVRTTAMLLQTLLEVDADFPDAPKTAKWLINAQKMGRWNTTQENVYAFDAMRTYFKHYESVTPDFTCDVFFGKTKILSDVFKGRELKLVPKDMPMSQLETGKNISVRFEKKGKGRLYYTLRLKYMPLKPVKCRDEGIAVFKSIEPVDQVRSQDKALSAGKVYKVTLSIVTPQERSFVVVEDPLPGGFVVVNSSFATEKGELIRKLEKIREKENQGRWFGTFNHWEMYDEKVLLFADILSEGEHRFTYFVRAMYFGSFLMPSTKAEMMYEPEIFGYSTQKMIEIK